MSQQERKYLHIQSRTDTKEEWYNINPKLLEREIGYEKNTGQYKIGDGETLWRDLPYAHNIENGEGQFSLQQLSSQAKGAYSHSEGFKTQTGKDAQGAHSEGGETAAMGLYSHAEGYDTTASGENSHAEGNATKATNNCSHSEGGSTEATGDCAHAEGRHTIANGDAQHVQGRFNISDAKTTEYPKGKYAHIVGNGNIDNRSNAHTLDWDGNAWFAGGITLGADNKNVLTENDINIESGNGENSIQQKIDVVDWSSSNPYIQDAITEGMATDDGNMIVTDESGTKILVGSYGKNSTMFNGKSQAVGGKAHAEGSKNIAFENNSHAEGNETFARGKHSHAEGNGSSSIGNASHSEGTQTVAKGISAHAEGASSKAEGDYSHAEGSGTHANGHYSHAEGNDTYATKAASHAEGGNTHAEGDYSHAEGCTTYATESCSHAEGFMTYATKPNSHAEGENTRADGHCSHAEGYDTHANEYCSHAEGEGTYAVGECQHVQGRFNISDAKTTEYPKGKYAHIIGNGDNDLLRSNAHTIDWDGNAWFAGKVECEYPYSLSLLNSKTCRTPIYMGKTTGYISSIDDTHTYTICISDSTPISHAFDPAEHHIICTLQDSYITDKYEAIASAGINVLSTGELYIHDPSALVSAGITRLDFNIEVYYTGSGNMSQGGVK